MEDKKAPFEDIATDNPDLVDKVGEALSEEAAAKQATQRKRDVFTFWTSPDMGPLTDNQQRVTGEYLAGSGLAVTAGVVTWMVLVWGLQLGGELSAIVAGLVFVGIVVLRRVL